MSHCTMVQPPLMTYMVADGSMCVPQLKSHSVLSAAAVISVGAPSVHSQLPPPLYTSAAPLYSSAAPPAAPTQARNGKRPLEENMFAEAGSGLGLPYGQPLQRHVTEQRHVTDVSAELLEAAARAATDFSETSNMAAARAAAVAFFANSDNALSPTRDISTKDISPPADLVGGGGLGLDGLTVPSPADKNAAHRRLIPTSPHTYCARAFLLQDVPQSDDMLSNFIAGLLANYPQQ